MAAELNAHVGEVLLAMIQRELVILNSQVSRIYVEMVGRKRKGGRRQ